MSQIQNTEQTTPSKDDFLQQLLKLKQEGKFEEFSSLLKSYTAQESKILSSSLTLNSNENSQNQSPQSDDKQPKQQHQDKENQEIQVSQGKSSQRQSRAQEQPKMIQQLVRLTKPSGEPFSRVYYGQCLPGYIMEEPVIVENISQTSTIICEVKALCQDDVLNDLDEYVYSVRRKENYSYNEAQMMKIRPGGRMQLFIALKTPNLKKEQKIPGKVVIKVAGARNFFERDIDVDVKIPQIQCLKTLYSQQYEMQVIKLAMKLITKADCKIPFKNLSKFNVKTEFELVIDKDNKFAQGIEFKITPEQGVLPGNQVAMAVLNAKRTAFNYETSKKKEQNFTVNLMLLVKIQNASLIFCFPLIVEIY